MKITEKNIFKEAERSNLDVLKSPLVATLEGFVGATPLHYLCSSSYDMRNWKINKLIDFFVENPSLCKLEDNDGRTPIWLLALYKNLTEKHMKKLFPWYCLKGKTIDGDLIDHIIETTPNSVWFIMSKE